MGSGTCRSKKEAEQSAARSAPEQLKKREKRTRPHGTARDTGDMTQDALSWTPSHKIVIKPKRNFYHLPHIKTVSSDMLKTVFVITQHYRFLEIAFRKSVYDSKKNLMRRDHLSFDSSVVSETAPSSRSVTT